MRFPKGRFPRGKRGLKSLSWDYPCWPGQSLPPREAWIEIIKDTVGDTALAASLPPREAWIEIVSLLQSHPS